jgi:hypothetical protein
VTHLHHWATAEKLIVIHIYCNNLFYFILSFFRKEDFHILAIKVSYLKATWLSQYRTQSAHDALYRYIQLLEANTKSTIKSSIPNLRMASYVIAYMCVVTMEKYIQVNKIHLAKLFQIIHRLLC